MPTYEYVCEGCGCKFERFQSITAKPVRTCPECGQNKAKRLIGTGGGIIFKGSGFYETDYRSEDYKKAAEQEKKSADKDTTQKDSKSKGKESKGKQKAGTGGKEKKKSA